MFRFFSSLYFFRETVVPIKSVFLMKRIFLPKFIFLIFIFSYINLRFTLSLFRFERCYFGSTWDWDHYQRSIERAGIISPVHQVTTWQNDFENLALSPVVKPSPIFTRSGLYSIAATEKGGRTPLFSVRLDAFGYPFPKLMDVEAWVLKPGNRSTGATLAYTLNLDGEALFGDEQKLDSLVTSSMTWIKVDKTFIIPDVNDSTMQINIFIANPKRALIYVDDLKVHYHYKWN